MAQRPEKGGLFHFLCASTLSWCGAILRRTHKATEVARLENYQLRLAAAVVSCRQPRLRKRLLGAIIHRFAHHFTRRFSSSCSSCTTADLWSQSRSCSLQLEFALLHPPQWCPIAIAPGVSTIAPLRATEEDASPDEASCSAAVAASGTLGVATKNHRSAIMKAASECWYWCQSDPSLCSGSKLLQSCRVF